MNGSSGDQNGATTRSADGESSCAASQGFDDLLPAVHDELHLLAAAILQRNRTLDPTRTTSLIHDVYVRLANRGLRFRDRSHFLCLAAKAMRLILIDRARRSGAAKRGGNHKAAPIEENIRARSGAPDLLAVEEALTRLAGFDERKARIVELRFFGGLSVEETAEVLGTSPSSVKREWSLARAWLSEQIGEGIPTGE